MSKKHFVALANNLFRARPEGKGAAFKAWVAAVDAVADASASANPAFDRARFVQACGVTL